MDHLEPSLPARRLDLFVGAAIRVRRTNTPALSRTASDLQSKKSLAIDPHQTVAK
jgi:hypothetical protein